MRHRRYSSCARCELSAISVFIFEGFDIHHHLSARAYHHILKWARTIADLAEALQAHLHCNERRVVQVSQLSKDHDVNIAVDVVRKFHIKTCECEIKYFN